MPGEIPIFPGTDVLVQVLHLRQKNTFCGLKSELVTNTELLLRQMHEFVSVRAPQLFVLIYPAFLPILFQANCSLVSVV